MRLLTTLCLTGAVLSKDIFQSKKSATQQLHYRARRDNNGIFEEVRPADLTRECIDEVCSYDEVLEAYNNDEAQAKIWWTAATKMCEIEGSCNRDGTQTCVNKWRSRECKCKAGWQNLESDNCSEDIDECANPDWCSNESLCENSIGSFTCHCTEGWEGAQCSEDINECEAAVNPCQNDGICTNTEGSFTCECNAQWTGDRCEIDVDECAAEVDPCQNESSCINTQGSYQCLCNNGWGGQNCDTDFDECGNGLCPKGTVCQALEMNQFTCVCPERGCNNLDEEEYQHLLAQVDLPEEASDDEDQMLNVEENFVDENYTAYEDVVESDEEAAIEESDDVLENSDDNQEELVEEDNFQAYDEDYTNSISYENDEVVSEDDSEADSEAYSNVLDSEEPVEEVAEDNLYGDYSQDSTESDGDSFYDSYNEKQVFYSD